MARSAKETDSGSYVNGVYTSKNGNTRNGGLNCPKGTRLYDPNMMPAIYYQPDDTGPTESFELITQDIAPGVLPYYAISNYGRVININTGNIMKPNYRPQGSEYLCLAAENCKYGQKKYTVGKMVLKKFDPIENENMDKLGVIHINGNHKDNYIGKTMPDGTIQTNLEWNRPRDGESCGNRICRKYIYGDITMDDVKQLRELHDEGYSYEYIINNLGFDDIPMHVISAICKNEMFTDPEYTPVGPYNYYKVNPGNMHRISDYEAEVIRGLHEVGFYNKEIRDFFFPDFSESTISDIVRNVSYNRFRSPEVRAQVGAAFGVVRPLKSKRQKLRK